MDIHFGELYPENGYTKLYGFYYSNKTDSRGVIDFIETTFGKKVLGVYFKPDINGNISHINFTVTFSK